ncbi:unnamed protein product [Clonostachys byssicola]|uniref:Gfo/Idh/MocA-like oxidoreductase N-terminal domain-containing protein n=1 Tax=Clonostachys byssicola TaxID=160290 RepID=A0A9N9UAK6_9HYPO|nr:unnamed protein product [Clonostachys byssicola]
MSTRIAIIGLSSSGEGWAANAHLPYLLSPRGRERFSIVAVCNSSLEAAKRSIDRHQLPSQTRTYGDPEALAQDSEIDLVVCCTRVDKHYNALLPSIKAGKDVYLEWPLAHNFEHSKDLVDAARRSGSKTFVGLQGRFAPSLAKLKNAISEGRIGLILSAEVRATGASSHPDAFPRRLEYFTDMSIGGNIFTIYFGHIFDQVQHVLGTSTSIRSKLQIQRPNIRIVDPSSGASLKTVISDVPDLIMLHSQVKSKQAVQGAALSCRFRLGSPFPGEPAMVWSVIGERGELRLTAWGSTTLQAHGYDKPVVLEVRDFATEKVENLDWEWSDWQMKLPVTARSVGRLYEAIVAGTTDGLVTFEEALEGHLQLEEMMEAYQMGS